MSIPMIIAPDPRRAVFVPFTAILLTIGFFLALPGGAAGTDGPPAASRDFHPIPLASMDVSSAPAVPTPKDLQAVLAKEEAGMAAAMHQVSAGKADYRLAPADLIVIAVYKAPEMSRKLRVEPDGNVSLPGLGPVKIAGLTQDEARARIEHKLAKYVIDPRISLAIEAYGSKTIFVMGEVQNPGAYALPANARMLVPDAVRTAGGFTPAAAQNRVRLLRYVEGASVTFTVTEDVILEPNDVVFIPPNAF